MACMTGKNTTEDGLYVSASEALRPVLVSLSELDDLDVLVRAEHLQRALLEATAEIAKLRRQSVRSMRRGGYLLREIAEQSGMSTQRISQIEAGYSRRKGV